MNKKAVLAMGGNAIIQAGEEGSIADQFKNTRQSLGGIVELIKQGYQLVITHGNGPQVGNLLLQQTAGMKLNVSPLPLGVLNAATEGTMGYMIEQSLMNKLISSDLKNNVITIVSQVQVDKNDPSIKNPSKPVGPFYNKVEADKMTEKYGWTFVEDAGRGYRQVVPSPKPIDIVPAAQIKELVEAGNIVIACGGGGIPFYRDEDGNMEGFDAVIDKDYASALLAEQIGAERLVILTGVEKVSINFGKPNQQDFSHLSLEDATKYLGEGHFPAGNMGPKISGAINFIESGGKEVLITSIEKIVDAFSGKTGTTITK